MATLRDRLKDAVRSEILEAAYGLFRERGFDEVSVEDIAARAGVSPRTFFRYFPAKEDVALQWLDDTGPVIRDALRRQPPHMHILHALRAAFVELADLDADVTAHSRFIQGLTHTSAKLRAGMLIRQQSWIDELTIVVAERLGLGPDDLEPPMWAGVAMAVANAAGEWGLTHSVDDVAQLMRNGFDLLEDAMVASERGASAPRA
jgi:AcrR family transcriptional regulator